MLVDDFIKYVRYEKNYSTHTVLAYTNDLRQFLEYVESHSGEVNLSKVTAEVVRAWMVDRMDEGLAPRSMRRKLSCLKAYWRFLRKNGVVDTNPLLGVVAPKLRKPLPVFLKESEAERLLEIDPEEADFFPVVRDRLILDLFYSAGLRLSELISLTDKDVDLSGCCLKVTGKRDKQRIVPFGIGLRDAIVDYLNIRNEQIAERAERLLVRNDGKPLYPQMVYQMVHRRLSEVGTLSKNSPHVLRHTFATVLLNRGAELNAVKELLGHASLSATEVYTHTTFAELKKVYKQAHPRA
jgi:integrase/recombinase XerC